MAQQNKRRSTQQNVRIPLIGSMTNRDSSGSKDQRFVNIYPETRKVDQIESTKIFLNKRPGLESYRDYGTGEGRGCIYFNGKFYVAVGNKVYEDAVSPVEKITLNGSTGHVGMVLGNSASNGDYLFVCDGTSAWTIDTSGTATAITSDSVLNITVGSGGTGYTSAPTVSFSGGGGSGATATAVISSGVVISVTVTNGGSGYTSAPTVSFSGGGGSGATATANLNSLPTPHVPTPVFIDGYIALAKGSDVYTCNVDEPTKWSSSDYLSAEIFPDAIKSLARQNNQIAVFGAHSTEFFYDAANASGSPFSRNDSTVLQMGIAAPYAVYQNERFLIFIAQSDAGGRAVWQVEGFQPKRVSDEFIDRCLNAEVDITDARGFGIRTVGHLFYVINLPTSNRTFVYDVDEKLWHEWSDNNSGSHAVFGCNYSTDANEGYAYLLHKSNGILYKFKPDVYQDNAVDIIVEIVTNRNDMDKIKRKFMSNASIVGDRYTAGNYVTLSWTDDDYQTWSNDKQIYLTDDFPNFARLGCFRRRAFRIEHAINYPLRMESLEITFQEGEH